MHLIMAKHRIFRSVSPSSFFLDSLPPKLETIEFGPSCQTNVKKIWVGMWQKKWISWYKPM